MDKLPPALRILVMMFAGWVNQEQRAMINYLREENRILREQMSGRRLRLTDDQRRRLASCSATSRASVLRTPSCAGTAGLWLVSTMVLENAGRADRRRERTSPHWS